MTRLITKKMRDSFNGLKLKFPDGTEIDANNKLKLMILKRVVK